MIKNSDYCQLFFVHVRASEYRCSYCGALRQQRPSSGYTNLMSHLRDKHGDVFASDYYQHTASQASSLRVFGFANKKATTIYS
ncbi:hypothetical protein PybrP1_012777 [[Pythium] brassicae (nom. inval.)]|nr:hypothetical protein PybrP1_012777 [[Pythium] brassicae (nom. inval.)]